MDIKGNRPLWTGRVIDFYGFGDNRTLLTLGAIGLSVMEG